MKEKRRTFGSYEELECSFKEQFQKILRAGRPLLQNVLFEKRGEDRLRAKIYTTDYVYNISATTDGYLGCITNRRKSGAGDNHRPGNGLSDGGFNKGTWDRIKDDIIRGEIVPLSKYALSLLEEQGIDTDDEKAKHIATSRREVEEHLGISP